MSAMHIQTSHKWRQFLFSSQVPARVLEDYRHLGEDIIDGFFKYRGRYYHISDFSVLRDSGLAHFFDAYFPDSYFSGVVLQVSQDGEEYRAGTYVVMN